MKMPMDPLNGIDTKNLHFGPRRTVLGSKPIASDAKLSKWPRSVWFLNVLINYYFISQTGPKTERLTILRAAYMRQSWETMTSVSADHIILTPTQPVGSGRPRRESNPGPPHQESRALSTELPRPARRADF